MIWLVWPQDLKAVLFMDIVGKEKNAGEKKTVDRRVTTLECVRQLRDADEA